MSFYQSHPFPVSPALRRTLTKRQAEIMRYLKDFIAAHEYAPSFEEIAGHCGYTSLATVHEHLSNLERKGWIKRSYNESRAIEVLPLHGPDTVTRARLTDLQRLNAKYCALPDNDWSSEADGIMEDHCNAFNGETIGWLIALALCSATDATSHTLPQESAVGAADTPRDTTADVALTTERAP